MMDCACGYLLRETNILFFNKEKLWFKSCNSFKRRETPSVVWLSDGLRSRQGKGVSAAWGEGRGMKAGLELLIRATWGNGTQKVTWRGHWRASVGVGPMSGPMRLGLGQLDLRGHGSARGEGAGWSQAAGGLEQRDGMWPQNL